MVMDALMVDGIAAMKGGVAIGRTSSSQCCCSTPSVPCGVVVGPGCNCTGPGCHAEQETAKVVTYVPGLATTVWERLQTCCCGPTSGRRITVDAYQEARILVSGQYRFYTRRGTASGTAPTVVATITETGPGFVIVTHPELQYVNCKAIFLDTLLANSPAPWSAGPTTNESTGFVYVDCQTYIRELRQDLGDGTYILARTHVRIDPNDDGCHPQGCPRGACCCAGRCYSGVTAQECAAMRGQYKGDGVSCQQVACSTQLQGACCKPDGTCEEVTEQRCDRLQGQFRGEGTKCIHANCPAPPVSACCLPSGVCQPLTQAQCAAQGGAWIPNQICAPNLCVPPPALRACCYPDGSCQNQTFADCVNAGGAWGAEGTTCATVDCNDGHRCCLPDGGTDTGCIMALCWACAQMGGVCTPGLHCQAHPCPEGIGAEVFL